tara:strand:+ start:35424 stop:36953 length:1530 start_codon:yes stop_codon:yes gene_type:complete
MKNLKEEFDQNYDIAIIGSGFGGSITAMGLKKIGYNVCVIEKKSHPRFAIGESSTPIADMILRDIADSYNLPFLREISRYGEWQKYHPNVKCGLKRGFSYFHHQKGKEFETDTDHSNELLVAASLDDFNSDTNWLRSDVDHFLIKNAVENGVHYYENTEIIQLDRNEDTHEWSVKTKSDELSRDFKVNWIIDASGSGDFSGKFFGTSNDINNFKTNSEAIYSHFTGVPLWSSYLKEKKISTDDYPYDPDNSALHQIIDEGWIWMLRFNNGLLSCGLVVDNTTGERLVNNKKTSEIWSQVVEQYPSIYKILGQGVYADPPGRMIKSGRLQRKLNRTFGEGWIALNHTAGFVDPMHSTGIAFTLSGIERILKLFKENIRGQLDRYQFIKVQDKTFKELEFIDLLVSLTYRSRWNPKLYAASVMLYFVASVQYEQRRLGGQTPELFLSADNELLTDLVLQVHHKMEAIEKSKNVVKVKELIIEISRLIEPFNSVGLLNDANKNMYRHTAVNI